MATIAELLTSSVGRVVLAAVLAFLVAVASTPLAGKLAPRVGMVAKPRAERWHQKSTPLLGGVGIFLGVMIPGLFVLPLTWSYAWLLAAGAVIFVIGVLDDRRALRPQVKLIGQIGAACLLLIGNVTIAITEDVPLGVPLAMALTIFWVVGITNAFNLIDNMDGLSAGTAAIAAFYLAIHGLLIGDAGVALLAALILGAALGFLVHNFAPARIFMGDAGSLFLGLSLAGLSLQGTHVGASDFGFVLLVPVAALGLPIFDTALVTILRKRHGRRVSQGGRDHSSHRLVALGLKEWQSVLCLYGLSALVGAVGLAAVLLPGPGVFVAGALAAIALVLFGVLLGEVRVYEHSAFGIRHSDGSRRGARLLNSEFWLLNSPRLAEVLLDLVLIVIAYLAAWLLRYEGTISPGDQQLLIQSLPYIILAKFAALLIFRVHRGLWRHLSRADALTIAKATTLGGLLSVGAITALYRFQDYSRTLFLIDLLLLTALMIGARAGLVWLRDWFASRPDPEGRRVLIVGAHDGGELIVRALWSNRQRAGQPVGFVDDDPGKVRRTLLGLPILGSTRELPALIERMRATEVIIAERLDGRPLPTSDTISQVCEERGVPCRAVGIHL